MRSDAKQEESEADGPRYGRAADRVEQTSTGTRSAKNGPIFAVRLCNKAKTQKRQRMPSLISTKRNPL
jgi:hypothetical protein